MKIKLAQVKKAAVAAVTFASLLVANGVLHGTPALIVMAAIGALGTLGVYAAKNAPSV